MDKHLIAISTLSIYDIYFLLNYAIAHVEGNKVNGIYQYCEFSSEGLMKIKSVHKNLEKEIWPRVENGK